MPVSPQGARIDAPLTQFATAYKPAALIADFLSPVVPVPDVAGKYRQRNRRDGSHAVNDIISPRGKHNEVSYDEIWTSFVCIDRGLVGKVSSQHRRATSANSILDADQSCVQNVQRQMALNREIRVGTQLTTSGNFTNTGAVGTVWTNQTSSTPISDIKTGIAAIPSGGEEGTMLVGYCALPVWNALTQHPSVLALKGMSEGLVTMDEFAKYLGLEKIYVSRTRKETANIGQTAVYTSYAFLATVFGIIATPRTAPSGLELECFSATFRQDPGVEVRSWDVPDEGKGGSEAHAVEQSDIEVIPQADQGYLLTAVAA